MRNFNILENHLLNHYVEKILRKWDEEKHLYNYDLDTRNHFCENLNDAWWLLPQLVVRVIDKNSYLCSPTTLARTIVIQFLEEHESDLDD